MVSVSRLQRVEHLIRIHWLALMEVSEYSVQGGGLSSYMKFLVEDARDYAAMRLHPVSYPHFWSASLELMSQSIFAQQHSLLFFAMTAHIRVSEQYLSFGATQGRPATLALPSLIASVGSIATIHLTLDMNFCALSLYSGVGWQKLPRANWRVRRPMRNFSLK
jgi:hypothetical protein